MATARIPLAALLLLATAGCALLPKPAAPSSSVIGDWVVEDIAGAPVQGREPLTVVFGETQRIYGGSGCNRYTGAYSYEAATGTLTMTPLSMTRRACLDPALMAQERRFIETLQSANRVEPGADGALALVAGEGRITIRRPDRRTSTAAPAAAPVARAAATPTPTKLPSSAPSAAPVDPLAPQAALGAPLPTVTPPPSTSSYPLAGGQSGAPLYPPVSTTAYPPSTATPSVSTPPASSPGATPPMYVPPSPAAPVARISATGTILADAPIPAGALVRVQIRDVSRAGQPPTVIGQQEVTADGGMSLPFTVTAPGSVIGPNARLIIVAQVLSGDRLLMINDAATAVSNTGAAGLSVRVVNAARTASPARQTSIAPAPAATPPAATPVYTPPAYTPPVYTAPATTAAADFPGARTYRCRGETFRIAFEDQVAFLATADGAVARLARIDASDDPAAPRMFSNSVLTVIRENADANARVRFARGRAALTTCTPE